MHKFLKLVKVGNKLNKKSEHEVMQTINEAIKINGEPVEKAYKT